MKHYFSLFLLIIICSTSFSFIEKDDNEKQLDIQSMLNCEVCEESVQEALESIEGITYYGMDFENHVIDIKYNPLIITEDAIKNSILEIGLPVDGVDGDIDAYRELPDCCKKEEDRQGKRQQILDEDAEIEENTIKIEPDIDSKKKKKKKNSNKKK